MKLNLEKKTGAWVDNGIIRPEQAKQILDFEDAAAPVPRRAGLGHYPCPGLVVKAWPGAAGRSCNTPSPAPVWSG